MSSPMIDVAIIGAGPYGLSIAANLRKTSMSFRIFGKPMQTWSDHMPKGMMLKSDGFASSLHDPGSTFTLKHYCQENGITYDDISIPVSCDVFVAYGLEFQKRMVPSLEQTNISCVRRLPHSFELQTADGQTLQAQKVIVAAGLTHFGYLPQFLAHLPRAYVSHSLGIHDLDGFRGKRVVVIGSGASGVDMAALLHEAEAHVEMVVRSREIIFYPKIEEPRPLIKRIKSPVSGLGTGWRSRIYAGAPLAFHAMPESWRLKTVHSHLGPASKYFLKDKVVGKFPLHLGVQVKSASVVNEEVHLTITRDGKDTELVVDHIIGATGFRVALSKLPFLDEELRNKIRSIDGAPVLSTAFECSVPGLYFVGVASANSFGPLTRFAYGAKFTAKRIARHLTQMLQAA